MRCLTFLSLLLVLIAPEPAEAGERLQDRRHDLAYGTDPLQTLDIYLPADTGNAPVIMMVHGGGWSAGDKRNAQVWRQKVAHWTEAGAIFVSVNYRLVPEVTPLEQAHDVARALAHVQRTAPGWGGNPQRLVLMGHSAGAHLVALLAADPTLATQADAQPWLGSVLLDSVVFDIEARMIKRPSHLLTQAFGANPALWRAASPQAMLQPGRGPILLVCSQLRPHSCPAARSFARAITSLSGQARVLPQNLNHRALNAGLGTQGEYTRAVDGFLRQIGLWSGLQGPQAKRRQCHMTPGDFDQSRPCH